MQPYRLTVRNVPRGAACGRRNLFTPALTPYHHPFFGGGSPAAFNPAAEFNGLVRLLDSAAAEFFPASRHGGAARRGGSFNPRFDVREVEGGYELKGEVPGVNQGDLQIEFEDERTLVIRGSTRREFTESNDKAVDAAAAEAPKAVEGAATDANNNDDAASIHSDRSSNYRKASVEDEYVDAGAEAADKTIATETEKPTTAATADADGTDKAAPAPEQQAPQFKYWVSERSVGEFERRFAFPGRVDQDAVTASLKNGILSVVVPKIVDKATRKIEIQ